MRATAWIPLGVAILLLGFELPMLAIALFGAQVSPAYRDFFIERRTALWAGETPSGPMAQDWGRISR